MTTVEAALSRYPEFVSRAGADPAALKEAARRVLDAVGCFYGAYNAKPARVLRETLARRAGGEATLWGAGRTAPAEIAALANGTCVRALDYNDTYLSLEPCHPSDLIASLWAACEISGRAGQGKTLLNAMALAYETVCRLCDATSLRTRGWDHVTYLPIASAVGCSYVFGLDRERTRNAVALAVTANNAMRQTRVGEISDWKAACAAYAARAGLTAARLAAAGFTGPFDAFAGKNGFFAQVSGTFSLGARRPSTWKILETHVKYFPAEHHAQSAIEAALEIRARNRPGAVASVLIEGFEVASAIIGSEREKWRPRTRETADHSMPYLVAAALLDGDVNLRQFERRRFADTDVLAVMKRTRVASLARYTKLYPGKMPSRVTVTWKDGRRDAAEVISPRGYAGRPMSDGEMTSKFLRLSRPLLGERAGRLAGRLLDIGKVGKLADLASAMEIR